jgi:hypothetical protein
MEGNLYAPTCLSPLTLLTSVHWGKPLNLFGPTYEVSVVADSTSLTMGYHYGPSADLLVVVCVSAFLFGITHTPLRYASASSAAILCTGGRDAIRKAAWPFYRTISDVRLCWDLEEPKGPEGLTPPENGARVFSGPKKCRHFLEKTEILSGAS